MNDLELSATHLGEVMGVTARRVRQLADDGVIERGAKRGRYRLMPSVARYCASTATSTSDTGLAAIREERLKRLQLENMERDRRLISLEEAQSVTDQMAGAFLTALSAMPARITRDPTERRRLEAITDEVRQGLSDRFAELAGELETGEAK